MPSCQRRRHHRLTCPALRNQMERKARLEAELQSEKKKLEQLKRDVQAMERDLELRRSSRQTILHSSATATALRVQQLKAEVDWLQTECSRMTQEVDLHNTTVPLGETDEEFYQNISPEHRTTTITENQQFQSSWRLRNEIRGATPRTGGPEEEDEDGPHWTCSVCTFRNHPALRKCEQCEMPRISLGTAPRPLPPCPPGCYCHPRRMPPSPPPAGPPPEQPTTSPSSPSI